MKKNILLLALLNINSTSCITFGDDRKPAKAEQQSMNQLKSEPIPETQTAKKEIERQQETKKKSAKGRVSARWQHVMMEKLKESEDYNAAVGLFSSGGWSDAGQFLFVFGNERGKGMKVKPGSKEISTEKNLDAIDVKTLKGIIADAAKLEDIDITSFDNIVYEFVIMERAAGAEPVVRDRLFIRNPGVKPMPAHEKLLSALQEFRGL